MGPRSHSSSGHSLMDPTTSHKPLNFSVKSLPLPPQTTSKHFMDAPCSVLTTNGEACDHPLITDELNLYRGKTYLYTPAYITSYTAQDAPCRQLLQPTLLRDFPSSSLVVKPSDIANISYPNQTNTILVPDMVL